MKASNMNFTARNIREGIKRGLCVRDYCDMYGVDAEEFSRQLRLIFRHDAEDIFSQILKSGKKREKAIRRSRRPVDVEKTMSFLIKPSFEEEKVPEEVQEPTPEESLELLKEDERRQSDAVMALENEYWATLRRHKENLAKIRCIGQDIEELERQFAKKTSEYKTLVAENDTLVEEADKIFQDCKAKKGNLADIRRRIELLQTICLGVYDDGQIRIEDGPVVALDDSRKEEIFGKLIQYDECQNLRMRDVKTLARLMAIIDAIPYRAECVFENDELESVFRSFDEIRKPVK